MRKSSRERPVEELVGSSTSEDSRGAKKREEDVGKTAQVVADTFRPKPSGLTMRTVFSWDLPTQVDSKPD